MASIFRSIDPSAISRDPYPHIATTNLLDGDLCRRLAEHVPPPSAYTNRVDFRDDQKFYRRGKRLLTDRETSTEMKEFVRANVSPEAFYDFLRLFAADIDRECPELDGRLNDVSPRQIGQRETGRFDVYLEAQLVYFMPIRAAAAAERGAHLKLSEKIYESFLSLRADEDISSGGDFVVHEYSGGSPLGPRNQIAPGQSIPVKTLRRQRNSYFGFLNTSRSVSEMTPRSASARPSVYLNVLIGVSPRLWKPSLWSRLGGWKRW